MSDADRLAYECAKAIKRGDIGSRSAIGDALLDYMRVGCVGGPESVGAWMESYEQRKEYAEAQDICPKCHEPIKKNPRIDYVYCSCGWTEFDYMV